MSAEQASPLRRTTPSRWWRLDIHQLHRVSFWDATIVQAARQSGCVQPLSEDINFGAILAGVRVVNLFA